MSELESGSVTDFRQKLPSLPPHFFLVCRVKVAIEPSTYDFAGLLKGD